MSQKITEKEVAQSLLDSAYVLITQQEDDESGQKVESLRRIPLSVFLKKCGTGTGTSDGEVDPEVVKQIVDEYLAENPPSGTGTPGRGISSIARTDGDGSPGTTDTYTITYTDDSTSTYTVYNGATPQFSIGTVETLEAGSDATASISGTAEKPILNLGIPKGKDGEASSDSGQTVYIGPDEPTGDNRPLYWLDTSGDSAGEDSVVYTVAANLTNVTIDNAAESVNEGDSYAAAITAADGYVLSSVSVTMGGVDITGTAYASGNIYIASVTGKVVITAVAVEVSEELTTYTITNNLLNVTSDNPAVTVEENTSYTAKLTVADGYKLDTVTVKMNGVDVTADVYADGVITIEAVTGDVVITANAVIDVGLGNLEEGNIYGSYDRGVADIEKSDLDSLEVEKLYFLVYQDTTYPYNCNITIRALYTSDWSYATVMGNTADANDIMTNFYLGEGYYVGEIDIATLLEKVQTMYDDGTLDSTKNKIVQFRAYSTNAKTKLLYSFDPDLPV